MLDPLGYLRCPRRPDDGERTRHRAAELIWSRSGIKQEQLAASALYPHNRLDRGLRSQPVQDRRDGHSLDRAGHAEPAANESAALLTKPGPPISTCSIWPYSTSAS